MLVKPICAERNTVLVEELGKDHPTCMLFPGAVPGPPDVSASIPQVTLSHPGSSEWSPVRYPGTPLPRCQQHVMVGRGHH